MIASRHSHPENLSLDSIINDLAMLLSSMALAENQYNEPETVKVALRENNSLTNELTRTQLMVNLKKIAAEVLAGHARDYLVLNNLHQNNRAQQELFVAIYVQHLSNYLLNISDDALLTALEAINRDIFPILLNLKSHLSSLFKLKIKIGKLITPAAIEKNLLSKELILHTLTGIFNDLQTKSNTEQANYLESINIYAYLNAVYQQLLADEVFSYAEKFAFNDEDKNDLFKKIHADILIINPNISLAYLNQPQIIEQTIADWQKKYSQYNKYAYKNYLARLIDTYLPKLNAFMFSPAQYAEMITALYLHIVESGNDWLNDNKIIQSIINTAIAVSWHEKTDYYMAYLSEQVDRYATVAKLSDTSRGKLAYDSRDNCLINKSNTILDEIAKDFFHHIAQKLSPRFDDIINNPDALIKCQKLFLQEMSENLKRDPDWLFPITKKNDVYEIDVSRHVKLIEGILLREKLIATFKQRKLAIKNSPFRIFMHPSRTKIKRCAITEAIKTLNNTTNLHHKNILEVGKKILADPLLTQPRNLFGISFAFFTGFKSRTEKEFLQLFAIEDNKQSIKASEPLKECANITPPPTSCLPYIVDTQQTTLSIAPSCPNANSLPSENSTPDICRLLNANSNSFLKTSPTPSFSASSDSLHSAESEDVAIAILPSPLPSQKYQRTPRICRIQSPPCTFYQTPANENFLIISDCNEIAMLNTVVEQQLEAAIIKARDAQNKPSEKVNLLCTYLARLIGLKMVYQYRNKQNISDMVAPLKSFIEEILNDKNLTSNFERLTMSFMMPSPLREDLKKALHSLDKLVAEVEAFRERQRLNS